MLTKFVKTAFSFCAAHTFLNKHTLKLNTIVPVDQFKTMCLKDAALKMQLF